MFNRRTKSKKYYPPLDSTFRKGGAKYKHAINLYYSKYIINYGFILALPFLKVENNLILIYNVINCL